MQNALRINPTDSYANDFLGTVYFLEGNLEAALKYWNRVGKPHIETVQPDHSLRIRPALLDRALAFSPAAELRLADFETTRARLEGLGIFPRPRIQLAADAEGKFDAILNLEERNGWGSNFWEALLSTFSGIGYQTIYPEYDNIGGSGHQHRIPGALGRTETPPGCVFLWPSPPESQVALSLRPRPPQRKLGHP